MGDVLLQAETGSALKRGWAKLAAVFPRSRRSYAVVMVLAFAAIVLAAVQSYRAIDRELTEAVHSKNAALAQLAAVTLSEKMDRLVDIGVSLADRVRFRELIGEGKWVEASRILARVRTEFPFVDRLILTDVDGTLWADIPEAPEVMGRNFAERDWYKGVSREWKPYISNVYRRAAAPVINVFGVAVPIRDTDGKLLGSLLLQVRLDTLFEWTRSVYIGHEGYLYIVDRTGRVAFHPRLPPQEDPVDLSAVPAVRLALDGRKGVEVTANPGASEESVRAYEPVQKYGWAVIAEQPARAAFAARGELLNRLLLAYGVAVLFGALAAYLASRIVTERSRADEDRRMKTELEHRVAERTSELHESRERFRVMLESSPDAMVIVNGEGNIALVNSQTEKLFGYAREALIGQPVEVLIPERFRERHVAHRAAYKSAPRVRNINLRLELHGLRKDGSEFPADISLSPVQTPEGLLVFSNIRDITERTKNELKLREMNADLVRRTREVEAANRELESFSYSVSHDLRAPLRAIGGFSRILTEDYGGKLDDEGRRLLGVVRDNSQKMGELIDDLLELSRLGRKPLSAAEINTKRLVEEVYGELRAGSGPQARLALGTLPPAYGDAVLIKQAWVNLLGNAIKFSGKCGQPVIEVSGRENGSENVYCVKDNGAGFDMRYYDKLFGVFQRLHSAEEFDGTGVGLAIVQRVVTRHGGRVWAEGKVGEGAAFYFSLPKGKQLGTV